MSTRIVLLCSLLGLGLTGCGLFQVTVNGKPVGGNAPGGEAAADPNAAGAATADGTTAAAQPKLPTREVKLAEAMTEPVVLTGDYTGPQHVPVKVVTTKPRELSVIVLGGWAWQHGQGHHRMDTVKISPDAPLEFEVGSAEGEDKRPWHVVVMDKEQTKLTAKTAVHGHPRAGAPVKERQLDDYSVFSTPLGWELGGGSSRSTPEFAAELFTTVDERFFVWPTRELTCNGVTNPIKVGEPLIVDSFQGENSARVRRANGESGSCDFKDVETDLAIKRPAEVVMPPPVWPLVGEGYNLWSDEEFLPLADQKPRIAAYKERKAKASACLDREWSKHDPDGRAGDYDVVEYDSRGNVKKVERMSDRIMRKVEPVCKLKPLEKERDAIREELRKEAEAESAKAIEKVEARFAKK